MKTVFCHNLLSIFQFTEYFSRLMCIAQVKILMFSSHELKYIINLCIFTTIYGVYLNKYMYNAQY